VRSKRRSSTGSVARLATLNVARVIGVAEVRDETNAAESKKKKLAVLVASPPFERRHTLRSILAGTPEALAGDAQKNLVCFQMCAGLAQLHAAGVSFGGRLDASDVVVRGAPNSPRVELDPASLFFDARVSDGGDSVFPKEKEKEKEKELASATEAWRLGAMSTLEYLTVINARAGRFRGRRDRHAVVPWVADFSENPDVMLRESARFIPGRGDDGYAVGNEKEKGWRDLTKTKWRLTKGDTQLDFSFQHADPKFAHHVSDECLCETTTCVYLARQTPVVELKKRVRSRFVANEYPATVERLYAWSPDEAIPQFYDDPSVFQAPKNGGARENESSRLGDLRAVRFGLGRRRVCFREKTPRDFRIRSRVSLLAQVDRPDVRGVSVRSESDRGEERHGTPRGREKTKRERARRRFFPPAPAKRSKRPEKRHLGVVVIGEIFILHKRRRSVRR